MIPGDSDTYIDLDIKFYVRGKLVSSSGKDGDLTDTTAVTNKLLHSLFSQCKSCSTGSLSHNRTSTIIIVPISRLLTYGTNAASSHLSNSYSYLDNGDKNPCDPMAETHTSATSDGFIARWSRLSGSRDVQLFGRLHTDVCNVPLFLLPRVQLQIKLTKARPSFYLMDNTADAKTTFNFLDAYLIVRRVQPKPLIRSAHDTALAEGYNMTRVDLKTFTFSAGSKSRFIDNAVLGPLPKRLLFNMIKIAEFIGSVGTSP